MRRQTETNAFRKDVRLAQRRGKDIRKLALVINALMLGEPLPDKYRLHKLTGDWAGHWELHIEPDWLLIFQFMEDAIILARMGTHSDLFK